MSEGESGQKKSQPPVKINNFKCSNCGETFSTYSELLKHIRKVHLTSQSATNPKGQKIIQGETMSEGSDYEESDEKRILSDKTILDLSNLSKYGCRKCSETFQNHSELLEHIRSTHNDV